MIVCVDITGIHVVDIGRNEYLVQYYLLHTVLPSLHVVSSTLTLTRLCTTIRKIIDFSVSVCYC